MLDAGDVVDPDVAGLVTRSNNVSSISQHTDSFYKTKRRPQDVTWFCLPKWERNVRLMHRSGTEVGR